LAPEICTKTDQKLDFGMIRGFSPPNPLEPENPGHMQWGPALGAGLIAGAVLMIAPRGSPWSSVTFFDPLVVGRNLPAQVTSMIPVWLMHLMVSIIYGFIISRTVVCLRQFRAIFTGGLVGLLLYALNLLVVSILWPHMRGNEASVAFTHIVFGLLAAAAYRGLLKRKPVSSD
jgi:hypothetical protein